MTFKITNKGQAASGKFILQIFLRLIDPEGDATKFEKTIMNLGPGESVSHSISYKVTLRNGMLNCKADILMLEKEDWNSNDNNFPDQSVIVWNQQFLKEYLLPDFEVKLSSPDLTRPPTTTVKLLVEVTNRGNSVSPATEIRLVCKEKEVKKKPVPVLKPGETFRHEFQHKWYTLGSKKCKASVNSDNKIPEYGGSGGKFTNEAELTVRIK
jgi:hypothetical protein